MTLLGLKILALMIVEETKNFKSKALQEVVREEKRRGIFKHVIPTNTHSAYLQRSKKRTTISL